MIIKDLLSVWEDWILTYTIFPIRTDLKASIADALEASFCVYTAAIATHDSIYDTLIDIWNNKNKERMMIAWATELLTYKYNHVYMQWQWVFPQLQWWPKLLKHHKHKTLQNIM